MNFFYFWLATLAIKLFFGTIIPLSGDEAYYWVWSQKIQLGYFDHPPLTAWIFSLIPEAFKSIARWPGIILGHLTFWVWYEIFKLQKLPNWKSWQIIALLSPMLGVGSLIITPDLPLLFFWSLSCLIFLRAKESQKLSEYFFLGVSLGLGFLSKYAIVLLVPVFVIYLFLGKKLKLIKIPYLFLTVFVGFVCCLPVVVWNYQHDWISFTFQWKHGFDQGPWNWKWTTDFILGTILVFFPTLFAGFVRSFKFSSDPMLFHKIAAIVPLIFFTYSSFKGPSELNWALIAYPHMILLFLLSNFQKWEKNLAYAFWTFLYGIVLIGAFVPNVEAIHGKLTEPFKYKDQQLLPTTYAPLFTSTYQMASSLWYVSGLPVYKVKGVSRFDYFDMIPENTLPNKFFYIKEDYQEWPEALPLSDWKYNEVAKPIKDHTVYEVNRL